MCKKSYLKPLLILAIFLVVGLSVSRAAEPEDTLLGQVIVKMTPGTSKSDVARAVDGQVTDSLVSRNLYLLEIPSEMSVSDAVSKLEKRQGVMSAEPNRYIGLPEINQISQSFPDQSRPVYLQGVEPSSFYAQPSAYDI
ncbi:MAG TPA: hypothetical protein VJ983_05230, partial [candidate division Zixibacteria bacterium]|nr:hypothetical protein [candidate division Zixibacteria bacterium]